MTGRDKRRRAKQRRELLAGLKAKDQRIVPVVRTDEAVPGK